MSFNSASGKDISQSISKQEMFEISEKISKKFSPTAPVKLKSKTLTKGLSCQELLDVSKNISRYFFPKISSPPTGITLLSIDPKQLHIHWNLGQSNSHLLLPVIFDEELILQVYAKTEENKTLGRLTPVFESPIHHIQQQKKITISLPHSHTQYSAQIGQFSTKNIFCPFMKSNIISVASDNMPLSIFTLDTDTADLNGVFESIKIDASYSSYTLSDQEIKSL